MLLTLVRVVMFCDMKHLEKYANVCAFQALIPKTLIKLSLRKTHRNLFI